MKKILFLILVFFQIIYAMGQIKADVKLPEFDYTNPKEYEIGGIIISGVKYLDQTVLLHLIDLEIGERILIPGDKISDAINKLWEQELFSDVKISISRVIGDRVFLDIYLKERPRLSEFSLVGTKKSEADDIKDIVKLVRGIQVDENIIMRTHYSIVNYYIDKGFRNVEVDIIQEQDSLIPNNVILTINIEKNERIKINDISFNGDYLVDEDLNWFNSLRGSDRVMQLAMKDTRHKSLLNIFKSSKIIKEKYEKDKRLIIEKYNELGYRDARIANDTIFEHDEKTVNIIIEIDKGAKYYFRNISWIGNTKYPSELLSRILAINKGDTYNKKILDERLLYDPNGVMSLYQDNGYLFSNINPVEVLIENDSIDIEMRIFEGRPAMINRVSLIGNTRTNDHVILREIRTKPGSLYKRSEIQRTVRELAQLGYFDPEKLDVDFQPDQIEGTVDLEYYVEEKPSDQIELSGGWGAGMIVGTLGLSFNNFSLQNIFNPRAYRPLPSGDGQRLSLRAQASGLYYQGYSFTFVEPWFGGKKPNSLTTSVYHSVQTNAHRDPELRNSFKITGAAIGLGQRLKWPDDYFTLYNELSYKYYDIYKWGYFIYDNGFSNNISVKSVLGRHSSGPNPIFPTTGSQFSLSVELTPPYSLFNNLDYDNVTAQERYKWIEYHKWKFSGQWFTTLRGSKEGGSRALVLLTKFEFGLLGMYNKDVGPSPFEGFQVGGDGLYGYNLYGRETIGLRGYGNNSLTPSQGGNVYSKYTVELRYPISLNPTATLYALTFAEAGNAWFMAENFDPFIIKRSAGLGVRIFMPMIGMLGVDWGYGFDEIPGTTGMNGSQFHFVIGQQF